jgi:hypothetical protein
MKSTADLALLDRHLAYLCLSFVRQHCQSLATEAARKELSHLDYLAQLTEGEASLRKDRAPKHGPLDGTGCRLAAARL